MSEFIQNIKQALNADSNTTELNDVETNNIKASTERAPTKNAKQCNYSNDYYGDQICIDKDNS